MSDAPQIAAIRILFVCMGNICRSPTAEAVFRLRAQRAGLSGIVLADSAGTHGNHDGAAPDSRAVRAASRRGYDMSGLRSRPVVQDDFRRFHYILAMDNHNLRLLRAMQPGGYAGYLGRVLDFAPQLGLTEVIDPYCSGETAFEQVLDQIEAGVDGLIALLDQQKNRPAAQ